MGYAAWFQSLMVQPPVIMGRRLLPFSLIHSMTLEQFDSPFLFKHKTPTRDDLLLAVSVCSEDWDGIREKFFQRFDAGDFRAMSYFSHFHDISGAIESFKAYISDFTDAPEHYVKPGKSGSIKSPWQFHLVRILCREYGMSDADAWNTSVILARCYGDSYSESQGADTLRDDTDETLSRLAEELGDAEARNDLAAIERLNKQIVAITGGGKN